MKLKNSLIFIGLFLFSATAFAVDPVKEKSKRTYQVINLGSQFENFWKLAQGKPFNEQLRLWNEIVEKPHQLFYDSLVWQKKDNPKWEERKIKRLTDFFEKYPALYPEMMKNFRSFDKTLAQQIAKFTKFFPDAKFALPIYAAPTASFDGKTDDVLAFGIDMMVDLKSEPDILYSHELFHIYHTNAVGLSERVLLEQGRLSLPLWFEGFATYVSEQMNPRASLSAVLMDKDLANVTNEEITRLAGEFLSEANEKAFDPKKPEIYKKWFNMDPQFKLGRNLPQRCGYLLGLRVVQELANKNSISKMAHWKVPEIHKQVLATLKKLSGPRRTKI